MTGCKGRTKLAFFSSFQRAAHEQKKSLISGVFVLLHILYRNAHEHFTLKRKMQFHRNKLLGELLATFDSWKSHCCGDAHGS